SESGLYFNVVIYIHRGQWTMKELLHLMDGFVVTLDSAFAIIGLGLLTNGEMQFPTIDHDRKGRKYQYDLRVMNLVDEKRVWHNANRILLAAQTAPPVVIHAFYHLHNTQVSVSDLDAGEVLRYYEAQAVQL